MSDANVNGSGPNSNEEKVPCPCNHFGRKGNRFDRYCHPAELVRNRGVCDECADRIRKHHKKCRHGEVETPAEYAPLHRAKDLQNHTALDNHAVVQFADFNYDELDSMYGEIEAQPADVGGRAAEILAKIFVWVWSAPSPRAALVKFSALAAGLRDDLVGRNYTELAVELGVTKASLSKAAVRFQSAFGIQFSRSRSKTGCANMSAAQKGHVGHGKTTKRNSATTPATLRLPRRNPTQSSDRAAGVLRA